MLSTKQLDDIKKLQTECERGEDFQLKLNWDMLRRRSNDEKHDFFHYENNELVGFLGLYGFGSKIELCGMVKPSCRRKGIFSKLFNEALDMINTGNYNEILLNSPSNSLTGKAFVNKQACEYSMSEHQMKYREGEIEDTQVENEHVMLRHAETNDFDTMINLDVQCFHLDLFDAQEYNERRNKDTSQQDYMIDYLGETVGKIRIARMDGESWIHGFAIFPEYQGRGIGKQTLLKVVQQERELGYPLFLEVEARNAHALKLYESCGFRAYHSQDYYTLRI